ncbi:MAG: TMEM43 family protein [Mariniblastus sp.]
MVEVISNQSWFSRMGGAIKGVIFGCLLFLIAIPVLFMNEGRSVRRAKGLAEGAGSVVEVETDQVDAANEGKFVHLSGTATTKEPLADEVFGIVFDGIRLERHVEMYQWVETTSKKTKKKLGGGTKTITTYDYEQKWAPKLVNSSEFEQAEGHQNPTQMPYEQFKTQANDVELGAFKLSKSLVGKISKPEVIKFEKEQLPEEISFMATISQDAPNGGPRMYIAGGSVALTQKAKIGDVRIWFTGTPETEVSVMAKQVGNSFEPFKTHSGTSLNMLETRIASAELMIEKEQAANTALTWMLRMLGIGMMCGGLGIALRPLAVMGDVVPFIGSIVGFGMTLIATVAGTGAAFCVISVAWLFYRPLIGVPLLVIGAGLIFWTIKSIRSTKPAQNEDLPVASLVDN